jgi:hypothetical protein
LLMDSKEVELSSECPGGPEIFEMVANFCYGSTILMESSSVAALRCMAEYLHMSEEYGKANLCQRSELYLTQVRIARTLSWKHFFSPSVATLRLSSRLVLCVCCSSEALLRLREHPRRCSVLL